MSNKGTALQAQKSGFLALANNDIGAMMAEELSGLDAGFERIKIPSGGTTVFEMPGEGDETESVKEDICCKGWMSNPLLLQSGSYPIRSRVRRQARGRRQQSDIAQAFPALCTPGGLPEMAPPWGLPETGSPLPCFTEHGRQNTMGPRFARPF